MLKIICSESNTELCQFESPGEDSTVFLGDAKQPSLSDFLKIFGEEIKTLPEGYEELAKTVGVREDLKMFIVPRQRMQTHRAELTQKIQDVVSDEKNRSYLQNYIRCKSFLGSLQQAVVDKEALNDLIDRQKHDGVVSNLASFSPLHGLSSRVKYSMSSSSTGRLSVLEGPKILTAPSEVKGILRSRFKDGKVLQVDLCSAEPNFALFVAGKKLESDVYSDMCNRALSNSVDRKIAKLVTLSALYGQSTSNLKKQLPANLDAASVINKVRRYLSYGELLKTLEEQLTKGDFRNYLGRPLFTDKKRLLVSHFLQSSVAEASILAFASFCQEEKRALPVFVIHDALIIDCEASLANELLEKKTIHLDFADTKFPATISSAREYL